MQVHLVNLKFENNSYVYRYMQDVHIAFNITNLHSNFEYSFKVDLMEVLQNDCLQPFVPQLNRNYAYSIFSLNPTKNILQSEKSSNGLFTLVTNDEGLLYAF